MKIFSKPNLLLAILFITLGKASQGQTSVSENPVTQAAKKETSYARHTTNISSVAFAPNGEKLASAGGERIKVTDLSTGKEILTLKSSRGMNFLSVVFSPDGRWLIGSQSKLKERKIRRWGEYTVTTYFYLGETVIWDARTGAIKTTINDDDNPSWQLAISPDGKMLAIGTGPTMPKDKNCKQEFCAGYGEVLLVSTSDWKIRTRLKGKSQALRVLTFSPDSKWLAGSSGIIEGASSTTGGVEFEALIWKVATGALQENLPHHARPITALAFSPDSRLLATASLDRSLRIWEAPTLQLLRTTSEYTISYDELITITDQAGKKKAKDTFPKISWLDGIVFAPDGKTIIGSGGDGILRFYDAGSGKISRIVKPRDWPILSWNSWPYSHFSYDRLKLQEGLMNSIVLAPGGKILATGAADGKIRLMSLE